MAPNRNDPEAQGGQRISAFRIALKSFTTQWFLIPQGTGILAVILHNLHYQFHGLAIISQIFWVITIVTLVGFLLLYLLRVIVFPRYVAQQLSSNVLEMACLSSISIAFTTIIQMIALNLVTTWAKGWGLAAWILWWINAVMAAVACIGIPYVFTKIEGPGTDMVPPGVLLPLIAALTAAAGGGVICRYGELDATLQVPMIIVSYLFIGLALPLSLAIDAVFLVRLFDKSFPVQQKVYQLMILCGPLGQGAYALMILGNCAQRGAFANYDTSSFLSGSGGSTVATASELLGLLTWGYGIFWWAFACIAIAHYMISSPKALLRLDQSLSAWSIVFPWGVYTNAAVELGVVLHSRAFWVVQTILVLLMLIFWFANVFASIIGVLNGKLLNLDHGWRGTYYTNSAEDEKQAAGQSEQQSSNGGQANGQQQSGSQGSDWSQQNGDAQNGGLRQRDR